MARGVYSGKVSEWSITSWKSISSALIGLVPEPSHDLREGVRSGTGSDWTGGTYTTLTHGGSVRKPFGSRRWHRNWPDVLPVFNGDQSTRVLSTVWDLLFTIGITSQVDNLPCVRATLSQLLSAQRRLPESRLVPLVTTGRSSWST